MTKEHTPTHRFELESPSLKAQAEYLAALQAQLLRTLSGDTIAQRIAAQCEGTPLPDTRKFHLTEAGVFYSVHYRREIDRRERVQHGQLARFESENILVASTGIGTQELEKLLEYFDTLHIERSLGLPNLSDDYSEIAPPES